MKLRGEALREVSFPVGGIGAGCIGLAGNGRLIDWEIFNHAGKGLGNGCSHFAVRAEQNGRVEAARILHGDLLSDLSGERRGNDAMYYGFGWGPGEETLCGLPHFRDVEFDGEFPAAELTFADPGFPGRVRLTAWSPFVPGESDLASLPVALYEITLENSSEATYRYSCVGALANPWENPEADNRVTRTNGLTQLRLNNNLAPDSFDYGELALSTDAEEVSFQEYWYRGRWRDFLEVYWNDLNTPGAFRNRSYSGRTSPSRRDCGMLGAHFTLAPGERKTVRFLISWYVPNRRNTWDSNVEEELRRSGLKENRWKNYYTRLCSGAADAAQRFFPIWQESREKVFLFRRALHESTIPAASLEGAAANLSVLISPTCLRVEDGTLWGWEGVGPERGSCPGTCQHVWNYAQALPLLFPDLERSIRESQAKYGFDENGGWQFRLRLPLGIRARARWMRPCVDGSYGEVMKIYREWKISGDTKWLNSIWFAVRQAIEYAWSPKNPDRWDPEQSGVITGRQHHTLDVEQFGPSGWLTGHYLGALKAAAEMAPYCGDPAFGTFCAELFEKGKRWCEEHLFNGEYYQQAVDIHDPAQILPFLQGDETAEHNPYWDAEHCEIKYQAAEGCEIDAHLGQWYASLYGIGEILAPERIHSTLRSIYRYNFRPSLREFANTWRTFSVDDEGGCIICVWPEGREKPVIPLPYNSETMTGFEWAVAAHLVMTGEPEKGEELARAIRRRYDGRRRNPWNEIECGSNYARSMASYAMLQAYSGFCYDMVRGMIGFRPVLSGDFRCFWSLGTVWGTFERTGQQQTLHILHGEAEFSAFRLQAESAARNGAALAGAWKDGEWIPAEPVRLRAGDRLTFTGTAVRA